MSLEAKIKRPALTSLQRRNLARLSGKFLHSYEFFYTGPFSEDVTVSCDLYLRTSSCLNDINSSSLLFNRIANEVGNATEPQKCFELIGIANAYFTKPELKQSYVCDFSDWPELFELISSSEILEDIYSKTSLTTLMTVHFHLMPKALDGIDLLEVNFVLS